MDDEHDESARVVATNSREKIYPKRKHPPKNSLQTELSSHTKTRQKNTTEIMAFGNTTMG